jgi:hypothetical protein
MHGILVTAAAIAVIVSAQGCDSWYSGDHRRAEKAWLDLVKSEWGSCPVEGSLNVEIVERTDDPSFERIGYPKAGSTFQIDFYIESRQIFHVTARDDDKMLANIVADGFTYTFDNGDVFSVQRLWDEEDYDELARLWPLNTVLSHLFPVSHGLIFTPETVKATQKHSEVSVQAGQGANTEKPSNAVDMLIGSKLTGPLWAFQFELTPKPRVLKSRDLIDGEVTEETVYSEPFTGADSSAHTFMRHATWRLDEGWTVKSELEALHVNVRRE